jgi:hypothetical protein
MSTLGAVLRRARQQLLTAALELREHPLALGTDQGGHTRRLDEQQAPGVGVALETPQELLQCQACRVPPVGAVGRDCPHRGEDALAARRTRRQEALFL